jgi:DNA-binding MarR family transcriptional regulator
LDLSLGQLTALIIVAQDEVISIGRLGELINLSRPRTSEIVSTLVARDLVIRVDDPADRRRAQVCLSTEGTKLVEDLFPTGQALAKMAASLADPELIGLAQALGALARTIDGALEHT